MVCGSGPQRRTQDDITIFKSCGIGTWDLAVAAYVYRQALEKGKGRELDL